MVLQVCVVVCKFAKRLFRRKNDCSHLQSDFCVGKMTAHIYKVTFTPEK